MAGSRSSLAGLLVGLVVLWPTALAAAAWQRAAGPPSIWSDLVYLAASHLCHQRSERSFHTAGVQWPVCGRCSGLYIAAPIGALAAVFAVRRRRPAVRAWLAVAALPTALAIAVEWTHVADPGNLVRALAAVPLGAAIAFAITVEARGTAKTIE